MIPVPLILAGLELLNSANSSNEKENQEKVVKVFKKVAKGMPNAIDTRPFWKTKTFWSTCIGVIVPILNKVFGWGMDVTEVSATISPLLVFIATEQWKKKG